jgi:hypothetical protein
MQLVPHGKRLRGKNCLRKFCPPPRKNYSALRFGEYCTQLAFPTLEDDGNVDTVIYTIMPEAISACVLLEKKIFRHFLH